jgi:hypothetical protein
MFKCQKALFSLTAAGTLPAVSVKHFGTQYASSVFLSPIDMSFVFLNPCLSHVFSLLCIGTLAKDFPMGFSVAGTVLLCLLWMGLLISLKFFHLALLTLRTQTISMCFMAIEVFCRSRKEQFAAGTSFHSVLCGSHSLWKPAFRRRASSPFRLPYLECAIRMGAPKEARQESQRVRFIDSGIEAKLVGQVHGLHTKSVAELKEYV